MTTFTFILIYTFIDGLALINNLGLFEKVYHEIYSPELELKPENRLNSKECF